MMSIIVKMMTPNKPAETFKNGIRRAWLEENRIALIITSGDPSREAIDTWAQVTTSTIRHWSPDDPIILLHDFTNLDMGIMPYVYRRADDVYATMPKGQCGYNAVVLGSGIFNNVLSVFVGRLRGRHRNLKEQLFTTREDAHTWLHNQMRTASTTIA
jgi:hypothetical protein